MRAVKRQRGMISLFTWRYRRELLIIRFPSWSCTRRCLDPSLPFHSYFLTLLSLKHYKLAVRIHLILLLFENITSQVLKEPKHPIATLLSLLLCLSWIIQLTTALLAVFLYWLLVLGLSTINWLRAMLPDTAVSSRSRILLAFRLLTHHY